MDNLDIYESIAGRTQGCIYMGVVGPARTGKSTFIKRFLEVMVLPNLENPYIRERVSDEMPQGGAGRTITTTEPKFVPSDAVTINLPGNVSFKVRLVDCVGYLVPGAIGAMEDGHERMVRTPWNDDEITFREACETGTRKVITDHSTIGIIVTTDGTIGDIPRDAYKEAEERTIKEVSELGRPFIVIVNSADPGGVRAADTVEEIKRKFSVEAFSADCMNMDEKVIRGLLGLVLDQFPVAQVNFIMPGFVEGLSNSHWIRKKIIENIMEWSSESEKTGDIYRFTDKLSDGEIVKEARVISQDPGTGTAEVELALDENLFYRVVEEILGEDVKDDASFFRKLREFAEAKTSYDRLKGAISEVEEKGYGIVQPGLSEMVLEEPEVFRQGSRYGVRMTAKAPSLHIIKTHITTEISPVVGTEGQSQDLVKYLLEEYKKDPQEIWKTNIFGKTLQEMVQEQMESKISNVPDNIRYRVQSSLQKISDEGKDFFICIVL